LSDLDAVNQQGDTFFALYQQREDHSQLKGQTPTALHHHHHQPEKLDADFKMSSPKLPLGEGCIHFIRRVTPEGTVRVLNADWAVPQFDPTKGVWVTVEFKMIGTFLSIYDESPDAMNRRCLATYPFPLKEPLFSEIVVEPEYETTSEQQAAFAQEVPLPAEQPLSEPTSLLQHVVKAGEELMLFSISRTARFARHVIFTMY
jgi:hypothetical protein